MKWYALLIALHLAFAASAAVSPAPARSAEDKLTPGSDDAKIARVAVALLERMHYNQHAFNDDFSSKFLDRYVDALDMGRMLFIKSDLEDFERWRNRLDDLTVRFGDTSPAEYIFTRFMERFEEQVAFATNILATNKFEFTSDTRYVFNRKDLPRPNSLAEARTIWLDRIRYEFLQEKLNKQKPAEIVKTITSRYMRQLRTLREFDSDEIFQIYLSALARVYDPHSEYMGKPSYDNFNISMKLALFGIGAVLTSEDGYCKIRELMPGPAMRSKQVKPNDRVVAVAQGTNDPVDVVDWKLNKVVELIRGPKGSEVRLTIIPADATDPSVRKVVSLIRDEIKLEDSEAKAKLLEIPAAKGKPLRLGIIDLPSFYADLGNRAADHKSTTTDVSKLIKKLKEENVRGIILDLRRNGGGSLDEAINLTGLFIKEGPVVQVKDPDGTITVDRDTDPAVLYEGPLVVLTSRFSASASEILAGALQDYGRALVVGDSSTHGKGTVQSVLELNRFLRATNNLGALKLTIRKFYRANGESTQLKGVIPDLILPSPNNFAEIGESALQNPLPWDTVPPAKFDPVNQVNPLRADLSRRSAARVAKDRDFDFLREEIERYKKAKEDKSISLNEAVRLKEKQETETRTKARKKELEKRGEPNFKTFEITLKNAELPGLPPPFVKTNEVAKAVSPEKEKPKAHSGDPTLEDGEEKDDPMPSLDIGMEESKRVLTDLIQLLDKPGSVAGSR